MSIMEIGIHAGSPGLANRIKTLCLYTDHFQTGIRQLKVLMPISLIVLILQPKNNLDAYPCYDNWRLICR